VSPPDDDEAKPVSPSKPVAGFGDWFSTAAFWLVSIQRLLAQSDYFQICMYVWEQTTIMYLPKILEKSVN
jgi:hypothetical protein